MADTSENTAPKNHRHAWRMLDAADQFLRTAERCHESYAPVLRQSRAWLRIGTTVEEASPSKMSIGVQHSFRESPHYLHLLRPHVGLARFGGLFHLRPKEPTNSG